MSPLAPPQPLPQMLPPPKVDLATLLGEMAALKSEVRAETRASRDMREHLTTSVGLLAEQLEGASAREERLRTEVRRARDAGQRAEIRRLIDLLDRLEALLRSARAAPARGWWRWRRVDPAVTALAEGLGLTAARVQDALLGLGVTRVDTAGAVFDPHTMEAVETEERPDSPSMAVLAEIASGWRQGEQLICAAKVVVNGLDGSKRASGASGDSGDSGASEQRRRG